MKNSLTQDNLTQLNHSRLTNSMQTPTSGSSLQVSKRKSIETPAQQEGADGEDEVLEWPIDSADMKEEENEEDEDDKKKNQRTV